MGEGKCEAGDGGRGDTRSLSAVIGECVGRILVLGILLVCQSDLAGRPEDVGTHGAFSRSKQARKSMMSNGRGSY